MKKLACFVLTILLLAVWQGVSLADVSASYDNGNLTVSTDEQGFWEITVDDEWIGYWVGRALPNSTIPMKLAEGEHTVTISNPDENRTLTISFWVGENPAADASQPTSTADSKGPIKLESARYAKGVITIRLSGLRSCAEIWLDEEYTGINVTENGETSLLQVLSAGEHTLTLIVPDDAETDSKPVLAVSFHPDGQTLRAALTDLVKNEAGETLSSGLSIDMDDESYLLRVSVDGKPGAVLTIGKDQLKALLDQGLNVIEYVNGKSALRIDLTQITDRWFDASAPVTAYAFSLTAQEDGVQVTVEAQTEKGAVEASALAGITLIQNGERTIVESNGIH